MPENDIVKMIGLDKGSGELKTIHVDFSVKFGSDFQRNFFLSSLFNILVAIQTVMTQSHKMNKIDFSISFNKKGR